MPQQIYPNAAIAFHGVLWVPDPVPGNPPIKKIAQLTAKGKGNAGSVGERDQQLRAHVIPYDPKTPAQVAQRSAFAAAMAAWSQLTPEQKAVYNEQAKPLNLCGCNLFIRLQTT